MARGRGGGRRRGRALGCHGHSDHARALPHHRGRRGSPVTAKAGERVARCPPCNCSQLSWKARHRRAISAILAVTVDPHCQGRHAGTRRLRVDVHWCLSRNPQADVARLAARALSAHPEAAEELPLQPAESGPPIPPIVERRPNVPSQPENTHRRPAVAVRVQRVTPGVALALAAVLLAALGGGAAAADALLVGDRSSLARTARRGRRPPKCATSTCQNGAVSSHAQGAP